MINFNKPYKTGKENHYINKVTNKNSFAGGSHYSFKCSDLLEKKYSINKVLLTDSCTSALEIAALSLNLKSNDEVLIPSFAYPTTASAFLRVGCKIIFYEINNYDYMYDLTDLKKRINKKTKALVIIHYAGISANIDEVLKLKRK